MNIKNIFKNKLKEDILKIKKEVGLVGLEEKKDIYLVFETPKGENGLMNDIKNMKYFRSIRNY